MKQETNPFDDLIRQRIADLPPGSARGWEGLERRLDGSEMADAAIADKLNSLSPTAAPAGSWSTMASKLTAAETETAAAVDSALASGLQQAGPVAPTGWARLAARLELIGQRREMVVCLKISEAALLMSLLLIGLRFISWAEASPPLANAAAATGQAFPISETPTAPAVPAVLPALPLSNELPESAATGTDAIAVPPTQNSGTRAVSPLPASPIAALTLGDAPLLAPSLAGMAVAGVNGLDYEVTREDQGPFVPLKLAGLFGSEPARYYLNLFVSPVDLNQVITQENARLGIEAQRKLSLGYSVGSLLDVTQGKNGIQIGLIYGNRSYVPAEILRIEQDSAFTPQDENVRYGRLTYRTLSLPLNYERELFANDKWRLTGGVGMSMNIILASEFQLADNYTKDDLERVIDRFVAVNKVSTDGRASNSRRNILYPSVGYLQGGSIFQNSSLYLAGNLRVERLLTDRWSLYFAPTVSRLVTVRATDGGKGPLEDRIHNTMLRFGTRLRLSNK
ncbi:hypothetical protein [Lewinella sp. IMCC34183]|uniref:hypothetical protein n=1 Tax=Lewinella sp. IMCC34183 TaxID=2248762 RepID=UPI000E271333|nr:hypothetical protein [Lewinella sp. IMCC34183]